MKSLRNSSLPIHLMIADIHPLNVGLFRGYESVLIPKVEEDGAQEAIISILRQKKADVVMIGSAFDLVFFSQHKKQIERETEALVMVSPEKTVQIAADKWRTVEFFREQHLPYPKTLLPQNLEEAISAGKELGYPLILKPRRGTGSRNLHLIRDEKQLRNVFLTVPQAVCQHCISVPETKLQNEFSCSAFTCQDGSILEPFVARRILRSGNSVVVEVVENPEVQALVRSVAEAIPSLGSMNVQLMVGPNGPVPFELNARLSGTIATRSYFGFNEPEMLLRNYFLGEKLSPPAIRKGLSLSFKEDVFLEGVSSSELSSPPFPKGEIKAWF